MIFPIICGTIFAILAIATTILFALGLIVNSEGYDSWDEENEEEEDW